MQIKKSPKLTGADVNIEITPENIEAMLKYWIKI